MKKHATLLIIASFMMLIFNLSACQKAPIKVGFIGDLSSKNAQLAIDGRNAVEYYVNELNDHGGINGRLVFSDTIVLASLVFHYVYFWVS